MSSLTLDPGYGRLKNQVIEATGLAYYATRDSELAERLTRRLAATGLPDCAAYLRALDDGPAGQAELDALITELTIGETYFFRHPELFEALQQVVLPDLIGRNGSSRRLRIWSAGCATGAEAYSVAILLDDHWRHRLEGWEVTILGTDINRKFLSSAAAGRFEEWALRAVPEVDRLRLFHRDGRWWRLHDRYRFRVSFQYHNLVRHPLPSLLHNLAAFDLILCRNVLIYFSADASRALVARLRECLVEGGWLALGHAELNPEHDRLFRAVTWPGATLYQRPAVAGSALAGWIPLAPEPVLPAPPPASPVYTPLPDIDQIRRLADAGHWKEADRCCRQLLITDPLNPAGHFYHALVLEALGCLGDAEHALRRALYLDRRFALAHYHLGLMLARSHRPDAAEHAFRNVLDLLAAVPGVDGLAGAEGLTVAELVDLTKMQLEVLRL